MLLALVGVTGVGVTTGVGVGLGAGVDGLDPPWFVTNSAFKVKYGGKISITSPPAIFS